MRKEESFDSKTVVNSFTVLFFDISILMSSIIRFISLKNLEKMIFLSFF